MTYEDKVGTITVQEWKNVYDQAVKKKNIGHKFIFKNTRERFIVFSNDTSDDSKNDVGAMCGVEEYCFIYFAGSIFIITYTNEAQLKLRKLYLYYF